MRRQRQRGMTLIELMVVVVIIAILASIAYPSYRQYVIRANRTEAKTVMLELTQALEKCYTRFHSYAAADGCAVVTDDDTPSGNYAISATVRTPQTYTLQATPQGGQAADTKCDALSIDETGAKLPVNTGTTKGCW